MIGAVSCRWSSFPRYPCVPGKRTHSRPPGECSPPGRAFPSCCCACIACAFCMLGNLGGRSRGCEPRCCLQPHSCESEPVASPSGRSLRRPLRPIRIRSAQTPRRADGPRRMRLLDHAFQINDHRGERIAFEMAETEKRLKCRQGGERSGAKHRSGARLR